MALLCTSPGHESCFNSLATFLSLIPGKIGSMIRVSFYRWTLDECHKNVSIGFGTFISKRSARILKNVSIGAYCIIGNVEIRNDTRLASRCSIPSGRYQHLSSHPSENAPGWGHFSKIIIGERCWIGEGAIVMADIGNDCVVGAGSVVTRPADDGEIIAGNPARSIKRVEG